MKELLNIANHPKFYKNKNAIHNIVSLHHNNQVVQEDYPGFQHETSQTDNLNRINLKFQNKEQQFQINNNSKVNGKILLVFGKV